MPTTLNTSYVTSYTYFHNGSIDYLATADLENPPRFIPFDFEIIDWVAWANYVSANWDFPLYVSALYLWLIFGIQAWMKNREPFGLKKELFLWNASLGVFSIFGFFRVGQEFFRSLFETDGFYRSICVMKGANMPYAFWSVMFSLSKYVELGDTLFIVLRKKPLQLLQWFHHVATLLATWMVGPYIEPFVRYVMFMNYGVHSLMYPYFALSALGVKIPKAIANTITSLQLFQMISVLFVNFYSGYLYATGVPCLRHPFSIKVNSMIYGTFVILFGDLFYRLVVQRRGKGKKNL